MKRYLQKLDFADLRVANVKRCEAAFHKVNEWSPTDWATAMAGECGEACNFVKKLRRLDGADRALDSPESRAELRICIADELADLVIYTDLLAARLKLDLGLAVKAKFNAVSLKKKVKITL